MAVDELTREFAQDSRELAAALGFLTAMDRQTWLTIAAWNGSQKIPFASVAKVLDETRHS